ncbi:MAG: 6-phosphogluconolactonase [Myxococcota bacterium]
MVALRSTKDPVNAAASLLAEAIADRVEARGRARVAIPGGSALKAWASAFEGATWQDRVHLTWVDERCVPVDSPESNRGAARQLGALPSQVLPLIEDGETVDVALARVRQRLSADFQDALDVVLLGMGGDGHIASLFVGRALDGDRVLHIADSPKPPPNRITLTRDLLATAHTTILLATGTAKEDALRRLLAGDVTLPATGLPNLTLVTDLDLE